MTSGIKMVRVGGGAIDGVAYRSMAPRLQGIYEEEMRDAGVDGVIEAQRFIDTAGTGRSWSWSNRDGAPAGRIDSDTMKEALDYRLRRGVGIGLDVGWVNFWQEYFTAQDLGFNEGGARPDQFVAGMGMISHLRSFMRDRVDQAMESAEQRILYGL